jgi:hypothetical protein
LIVFVNNEAFVLKGFIREKDGSYSYAANGMESLGFLLCKFSFLGSDKKTDRNNEINTQD